MAPAPVDPLRQQLPRVTVPRPMLAHRLDRVVPGGLGLLVAPAGSGKSVLLRQWAASHHDLGVAALTCEPHHDDAVVFGHDLLATLGSVSPDLALDLGKLVRRGGSALGDPFVGALRDALGQSPRPITLVLDDLHALSNRSLVTELGYLLTTLPAPARAVVSTRRDLPWELRRLRLESRLVELRGSDLAFRPDEARSLLVGVSHQDLTDTDVTTLLERTDGWVAGLQLAAVSLQHVSDVGGFVRSFAGSDRLVAEYLMTEVIERQEPEVRDFLLRTSVLHRLEADLCDAVTGNNDARKMLELIEGRSLFLVQQDGSDEVFRYHHLFADLLRYELHASDPTAEPELHRRAADWLLDHGELEHAVDHLILAGERSRAFELIATRGHELFERGRSATLASWLRALDRADPDGPAAVGVNLMAAQAASDLTVEATETRRRLRKRTDLTPGQLAAIDALHAGLVLRDLSPDLALESAAAVRTTLPKVTDPLDADFIGVGGVDTALVLAEGAAGFALLLKGDVVSAGAAMEEVRALPGMAYPIWRVHGDSLLGLARAWAGRPVEALQLAEAAFETARGFGAVDHVAVTFAHMARGLALLDRGDIGQARRSLAESERQNRSRAPSVVHYFDLQRCLSARLLAVTDGPAAALALLAGPAASPVEPPLLAAANRSLRAQLLIGARDLVAARAVLSESDDAALAPTRVDLGLACGDPDAAHEALAGWEPRAGDDRSRVGHGLRTAAVMDLGGDRPAALLVLREAVALAERQGLRWALAEVPRALRLWRAVAPRDAVFADDRLWELARIWDPHQRNQAALVDPLTERELAVLEYLPGRIRNQRIAEELYISVNTLKTHLRAIYRKLDVADRDEAVSRATELGLL